MSRFVNHARLAAFALLASAAVVTPALADAASPLPGSSCALGSARFTSGCRSARHHAILRTAMVEPRGIGAYAEARDGYAAGRNLNLLILGVGF